MISTKSEAWLWMSREAEKIGAWQFADLCLDRYFEECYRRGIANALRNN